MKPHSSGFTIVELLIVVVIFSILAVLTLLSYNTVQAKARYAKSQHDVSTLQRAIAAARLKQGKTLAEITGRTYTVGPCIGNGVVPSQLVKTHACWTQYYQAIDAIGAAAGANLASLREGSQYGHPFYIDENENEDDDEPCRQDVIADRGSDFSRSQGDEVTYTLPWSIAGC